MTKGNAGGFTLLEVLIAMVILVISVSAVFQLLAQSKRLSIKADIAMEAARIMANTLDDPELVDKAVSDGEISGEVSEAPSWGYRMQVTDSLSIETGQEEDPYESETMGVLTVTLTHTAGERQRTFTATRWVALNGGGTQNAPKTEGEASK